MHTHLNCFLIIGVLVTSKRNHEEHNKHTKLPLKECLSLVVEDVIDELLEDKPSFHFDVTLFNDVFNQHRKLKLVDMVSFEIIINLEDAIVLTQLFSSFSSECILLVKQVPLS